MVGSRLGTIIYDMSNVIEPSFVTRLPIPVERILRKASEEDLKEVIVVGFDQEGEFYFVSSEPDGGDVLWLLEMAKFKLLKIGEGGV